MKKFNSFILSSMILSWFIIGDRSTAESSADQINGYSYEQVPTLLGAGMEANLPFKEHLAYIRHFDLLDTNHDDKHSKEEYIENGIHMNAMARRGIFNAADENKDGFVTKDEYVLNRIITDEAKNILQAMDDDRDGYISKKEFLKHTESSLKGKLGKDVFEAFDINNDASLMVPEYLRIWGIWARTGKPSAKARLGALREAELDAYWAEVSRSVGEGDFEGYAATCHPEGVLVSGNSQSSYPLNRALVRWRQGFLDTQSGKMKASVEFRFGRRVGNETSAHETGIFRYASTLNGEEQVSLVHFEALLVRKQNRWLILMENQKSAATSEEWKALETASPSNQ